MGRKTYTELNTVQGRYVLRSQLLDLANQLIAAESDDGTGSVTQVFFNTFMVQ
jgi:flagellar basal body-associated protein FliL